MNINMDLKLTSANSQGLQEVLEKGRDELDEFILDKQINYPAVKALVCYILSEHINSKQD